MQNASRHGNDGKTITTNVSTRCWQRSITFFNEAITDEQSRLIAEHPSDAVREKNALAGQARRTRPIVARIEKTMKTMTDLGIGIVLAALALLTLRFVAEMWSAGYRILP